MGETTGWGAYTDGSLLEGEAAGAGAALFSDERPVVTLSQHLSNYTVYQAELRAINDAARVLVNWKITGEDITFLVDNQASLRALDNIDIKLKSVQDTLDTLNLSRNLIKLKWVKAHNGHDDNELADEWANKARLGASV